MKKQPVSSKTNNTLSQAQQALDKAHNAVSAAQSHPGEQMIEQARNSLERAERAVRQAQDADGAPPEAVRLAQAELREERQELEELQ